MKSKSNLIVPDECKELLHKQVTKSKCPKVEERLTNLTKKQYDAIRPYFPQKIDRVLDLGGGLGRFSAYMAQEFPEAVYIVADYDEVVDDVRWNADYRQYKGRLCNKLALTDTFLRANGVKNYSIVDLGKLEQSTKLPPVDLLVSLFAVGYHYPIDFPRYTAKVMIFQTRNNFELIQSEPKSKFLIKYA